MPTLCANYVPAGIPVVLQSENGMLGVGPYPLESEVDADLINAGKETVSELPGCSYFDSALSFAHDPGRARAAVDSRGAAGVTRGRPGQLDGAGEDGEGNGRRDGPGGGIAPRGGDHGAHREGRAPKILEKCSLPLTGRRCVDRIITERAVIDVTARGLVLAEVASDTTVDAVVESHRRAARRRQCPPHARLRKRMFFLNDEHQMMRQTVREFAEAEIAPLAAEIDKNARFPHETFKKLGQLGLLGIPYPEEWGGAGADYLSYAIAIEEVARVCGSTALSMAAHTTLGCGPLHHFGTPEQKKKYLPRLTSGEILGSYGLTEPNSGSDAGGMQSRAVKNGDGWVLNGQKAWMTNGGVAGLYTVTASTDPSKKAKGITAFLDRTGNAGRHDRRGVRQARLPRIEHGGILHAGCARSRRRCPRDIESRVPAIYGHLEHGPHLDRRDVARHRPGGAYERGGQVLDGAPAVRQRPIAEFQAIQFMLADMARGSRRRATSSTGAPWLQGPRPAVREGGGEGALRLRSVDLVRRPGDPGPRRHGLHARVARRALLPRREAHRDRRGHVARSSASSSPDLLQATAGYAWEGDQGMSFEGGASSRARARPSASSSAALAPLSAPDLGAVAIEAAMKRAGIAPDASTRSSWGTSSQGGVGQAPARQRRIKAGIDPSVGAVTINKVCGSGLRR